MNEAILKVDLHNKIEHADNNQIRELYGLITNYFNGKVEIEEWDTLPEVQREMILKGLEQVDAGLGTPLNEVNQRIKEKYGLNG